MTDPLIPDDEQGEIMLAPGLRFAQIPEEMLYDEKLTDKAVRVFGALLRHAQSGPNVFPGYKRLGKLLHRSIDTMQRGVAELEAAGWITKSARFRADGSQTSNAYLLHASPLQERRTPAAPSQGAATVRPPSPLAGGANEGESLERDSVEGENTLAPPSASLVRVPPAEPETPATMTDDFAAFWAFYPRKVSKPTAARAYIAALRKTDHEAIMGGVAGWLAYWAGADTPPDKIPHPTTWLNGERWNDTPPPASVPSARRKSDFAAAVDRYNAEHKVIEATAEEVAGP